MARGVGGAVGGTEPISWTNIREDFEQPRS